MRRYHFLIKEDIFESLNRLRDAFLAAKNSSEVDDIINGLLTLDERVKIGRRIQIAQLLTAGYGIDEITRILKVGKTTIASVSKNLEEKPNCFKLLVRRNAQVEQEYKKKAFRYVGGSKKVFKTKVYTGFKRKDVKR